MTTNAHVRKALLAKLGNVTSQALSQRVQRLKGRLPMSTPDAVYVLAHQNGIDIGRYLDPGSVARIAGYVSQLSHIGASGPRAASRREGLGAVKKQVVVEIAGIQVDAVPGMTAKHASEALLMAKNVYPTLYVFENSARDVITRILTRALGKDWWKQVASPKLQRDVADRMKKEGDEAWHSKRGDAIQYVDLPVLAEIVRSDKAWPYFQDIFPRRNWFDSVVDDMNVSRRVVAHMNPISSDDVKALENGFRKWVKQLRAKANLIP